MEDPGLSAKVVFYIGMVLLQGSALFQIIKFISKKQTAGVSVGFWWALVMGLGCYLFYSIRINNWEFIISNSVGIFLSSISVALYYYYSRQEKKAKSSEKTDSGT